MSSQIVDHAQTSRNNEDALDKTKDTEQFGGLDVTAIDKAEPGLHNASGTSEQRQGEDLSFVQDPGEKGYVGTKTASENLIDTIEKEM